MATLIPDAFHALLIETLTDEKNPSYGQVATVDEKGKPQIRTVHLRYLKEGNQIAFAANTKSPKWRQLSQKPFLSGCLYDPHRFIQFRWESDVKLLGGKSGAEVQTIRKKLWQLVRSDVRSAYWLDHKGFPVEKLSGSSLDPRRTRLGRKVLEVVGKRILREPCPTFGSVLFTPHLWDIMEIDPKDYRKDRRTLHRLVGSVWKSRKISVLHSKDLGPFTF